MFRRFLIMSVNYDFNLLSESETDLLPKRILHQEEFVFFNNVHALKTINNKKKTVTII